MRRLLDLRRRAAQRLFVLLQRMQHVQHARRRLLDVRNHRHERLPRPERMLVVRHKHHERLRCVERMLLVQRWQHSVAWAVRHEPAADHIVDYDASFGSNARHAGPRAD